MFKKYATFYLKKCPKTLGVAPSLTPPTKVLLLLLVYLVIERRLLDYSLSSIAWMSHPLLPPTQHFPPFFIQKYIQCDPLLFGSHPP